MPAVGYDGGLEGGEVDIVVVVMANEGFEAVDPAYSCAHSQAVLDYKHRGVATVVALRGLTDFTLGYGIEDPGQAVLRVRVASQVNNVAIHEVAVGLLVDFAPVQ